MTLKTEKLESFPVVDGECNPFLYDPYNMGTTIGKDLIMMFDTHNTETLKWFILVDTETGERVKITIDYKKD